MNLANRIFRSDSPKWKNPARALFGYTLQRAGLSEKIRLRRFRYQIPFFAKSNVALTLWVDPDVSDHAEEFASAYLSPGDTFIDVGANIGCVAVTGSIAVGTSGLVFAIEPHPQTFTYLHQTVALNQCANVQCLNAAVGAASGALRFTNEKRKDDTNRVSLAGHGEITVPCITLADCFEGHAIDRAALVKIDTEGFEMHVLQGAENVLGRIDCLYVEILERNLRAYGNSAQMVVGFLEQHGFSCFHFDGDSANVVALARHASPRTGMQERLSPYAAGANAGATVQLRS